MGKKARAQNRSRGRSVVELWNWERPHNALGGKTPIDRICELTAKIPSGEAVERTYDPAKERIRVADYVIDSTLTWVK